VLATKTPVDLWLISRSGGAFQPHQVPFGHRQVLAVGGMGFRGAALKEPSVVAGRASSKFAGGNGFCSVRAAKVWTNPPNFPQQIDVFPPGWPHVAYRHMVLRRDKVEKLCFGFKAEPGRWPKTTTSARSAIFSNPSLSVTIGLTLSIPREEAWSWSCIALNSLIDLGRSPRDDSPY
jgi:hypothetical protein